jgi:prephenate dehydrogenase
MISNREELLAQSKIFKHNLATLEHMISSSNAQDLETLIDHASLTRSSWTMTSTKPQR